MARPCLLLALALIVGAAGHRGGAVRRAQPAVRAVRRTAFAPRTAPALSADTLVGSEQEMISITPPAMKQLLALKAAADGADLVLRMGVRSGGCSGMSYVMDMIDAAAIDATDLVIEYGEVGLRCVIDAKSSMFLYGLQLDYSDKLIGGGFGFSNPNAESTCGCGSSFSV